MEDAEHTLLYIHDHRIDERYFKTIMRLAA